MSSNGDKRSVSTDALETLGTAPLDADQKRDAIHLAVEPVIAGELLHPGQRIGLGEDGRAYSEALVKPLGIVDPFVEHVLEEGDRFWLVVFPRQIKSLRHVWEHPDFAPSELGNQTVLKPQALTEVGVSMAWIESYAASLSGSEPYGGNEYTVTAEELIEHAKSWVNPDSTWGGAYLVKGGLLEGVQVSPEFWDHFAVVTGLPIPDGKPSFFSCSC